MYLKSVNVELYPSAYRGQTSDNQMFNPESRLPTEYNVTNQTYNIADSFIISPKNLTALDTSQAMPVEFVIHGYWFKIKSLTIDNDIPAGWTEIYANIKLYNKNPSADYKSYLATSLINMTTGGEASPLDSGGASDTASEFQGLSLNDSALTGTGIVSFKLFEKIDDLWFVCKYSLKKLDAHEIATDYTTKRTLEQYLSTEDLNINDNDVRINLTGISATLPAADGNLNNFYFNTGTSPRYMGPGANILGNIEISDLPTYGFTRIGGYTDLDGNTSFRTAFASEQGDISYISDLGEQGFRIGAVTGDGELILDGYYNGEGSHAYYNDTELFKVTNHGIYTITLLPESAGVTNIGATGNRFKNIFATNLDLTGTITSDSIVCAGITSTGVIKVTGSNNYIEAPYFNATSDKRLKENIKDYQCKESILDLPVVEYTFKGNNTKHIGCLAQDLQKICPEIVHENDDGYLTIEENKIVYLLLDEVRKLKEEIKELKGE